MVFARPTLGKLGVGFNEHVGFGQHAKGLWHGGFHGVEGIGGVLEHGLLGIKGKGRVFVHAAQKLRHVAAAKVLIQRDLNLLADFRDLFEPHGVDLCRGHAYGDEAAHQGGVAGLAVRVA